MKLQNYQKKVLKAYSAFSPSKILNNLHSKLYKNLDFFFFQKLKLDKSFFSNKKILDLGCGTGEISLFYKTCGASYVEGIDFNPKSIQQANFYKKKKKITGINFYCKDIVKYKIKKKFDIIICNGVLPHINDKDRNLLFNRINNYNLSKCYLILSFLDSSGNLLKLSQQIITNKIYKDLPINKKFKYAKKMFKQNFYRFSKFGLRKPLQVYYDYFVNKRSYGLSHLKIFKHLTNFKLISSYPFKSNLANTLPIAFKNKNENNYSFFFLQQVLWFNNFDITETQKNKKLFEKYEKALISNNLKKINLIYTEINLYFNNILRQLNIKFQNAFKEFSQFNVFLNKIYGEKLNDLQKISLTEKKSFYKKFCGIGTVYIVLKKIN